MNAYLKLLRDRRDLRLLWLAGLVSQMGDWMSYVAISLLSIERGTGAVDVALVLVLHTVPKAVLSPISGTLADRFDRRSVMVWTAVVSAALTGLMAWAAVDQWLLAVQLLVLVRASVEALVEPARTSAVAQVVEREELLTAHALLATSWSVMFTVGMAFGGLLASLGVGLAIAVDALTFVVAAAVALQLPSLVPGRKNNEKPGESLPTNAVERVKVMTAISTAWRVSGQVAGLRRAVLAKAPLAVAGGGAWLLLNLSANEVMGIASAGLALGLLHAVRGIGTGIGPLVANHFIRTAPNGGRTHLRAWRLTHLVTFLGYGLYLALDHSPVLALLAMLLWGAGAGGNWVLSTARIQEIAPPTVVGRMVALDELAMITGMCVSVLAAGWLVDAGLPAQAVGWGCVGLGALGSLALFAFAAPLSAKGALPRTQSLSSSPG